VKDREKLAPENPTADATARETAEVEALSRRLTLAAVAMENAARSLVEAFEAWREADREAVALRQRLAAQPGQAPPAGPRIKEGRFITDFFDLGRRAVKVLGVLDEVRRRAAEPPYLPEPHRRALNAEDVKRGRVRIERPGSEETGQKRGAFSALFGRR
jgi:hypothetical protein